MFFNIITNFFETMCEQIQHCVSKNVEFLNFYNLFYKKLTILSYLLVQLLTTFNVKFLLIILISTAFFSKIAIFFRSMLANEKSKKMYFITYVVAITAILLQCILLVSTDSSDASDQGILLLYVYITATLMLFLIYLALTTCESVFDKESAENEEEEDNYKKSFDGFDDFLGSKSSQMVVMFIFYIFTMSEILAEYQVRLSVYLPKTYGVKNNNLSNYQTVSNVGGIYNVNRVNGQKQNNSAIVDSNNVWGAFSYLKFGILDTPAMYFLSALVQTCTLIVVIITLIV